MANFFRRKDDKVPANWLSKGDERAFDRFFHCHFKSLVFFAYRLVGDKSPAEDIVQEAFIRLWKKRNDLGNVTDIGGYLYVIVRHLCLDYLEGRQKIKMTALPDHVSGIEDDNQHLIAAETIKLIMEAADGLPPRMREVFRQYYLEDKSTKEISGLMETSPKTVDNQRQAAIRHIRERIIPIWKGRSEK